MNMSQHPKTWLWIPVALVVGLALAAVLFRGHTPGRSVGSEAVNPDSDLSPLGSLLGRASKVARLKARMQDLREVWPAMNRYADEHQGLLPTNVVSLQPYLPPNLTNLSDDYWDMPSAGGVAKVLLQKNDAVLLAQKNIAVGKPRIQLYGDGHIEYKP